ncbi:MAG: TRAP transporter large permease [Betaproteobacteria bacterium]|nr:TRAP transporter large permease [Betaproteobacteria bacterium]MBM3384832.1 TRAP transporter large permease [Betaproteobacteria bacterium]
MAIALAGFFALLLLILLRMPIAFAMGMVGFCGFWYLRGMNAAIATVGERFFSTVLSLELSVLPMFVLMGNLVARAGVAHELYAAAQTFLGHRRGGLAMATVAACGGFSAVCGSSLATAATMANVAMPSMRSFGYRDSLATASIAAGGTLGILIPPSVIMVIYGLMTETSINQLFAAGFLPGLIGIAFYMAAVQWTVWRDPAAGPQGERYGWRERLQALKGVWTVLVLFVVVLGGIYGGVFTPTEAAGIGAGGAFAIALLRGVRMRAIYEIAVESARTSAVLFFILIGALVFSNFINAAGLPEGLLALITGAGTGPMMVIFIILVIFVILGCVLESLSMILLMVPIFFPVVAGLDLGIPSKWVLVWFGVIVVMVTEISLITPPVGLNVYVLSSVLPEVSTTTIFRGMLPFITVDLLRLALFVAVPWISLVLPQLFYG